MNLAERAARTEQVLARFRDKPFDWAGANCIRLARAQAVALGHELPPVPLFRSALGARKALAKQGVESVAGLLDKFLPRHRAPAFAVIGDLAIGPAAEAHGLEAVGVLDGYGNLFGWHEASGFQRLETIKFAHADIVAAWRL